jgi:outer membrane lipoprotein-sorting protein
VNKLLLLLLLLSIFLSGCATVPVPVAVIQQKPPGTDNLARTLAASQIQASQMNQYISGIYGPNSMSQVLLNYQNANRQLSSVVQNPWNGFFELRNLWLPQ